jgi:hypothetical protein
MKLMRTGLLILAATVSCCVVAMGGVYTEDWGTPGNAAGWTSGTGILPGDIFSGVVPSESGGALTTTFSTANPNRGDRIYTTGVISGGINYTGDAVSFEYYGTALPSEFGLYFKGNAGSPVWYYDFKLVSINTPTVNLSPTISFGSQTGWSLLSGSSVNFFTDLMSVQEIGIELLWPASGVSTTYAIDHFVRGPAPLGGGGYAVPEPGTYAALGFAFASMGLTFRRRLNEGVEKIKGMLKA